MTLVTTNKAAQLLGMSADNVRYHVRQGNLLAIPVDRGSKNPMRLFVLEDIERFQQARAGSELATAVERRDV